LLNTRGDTIDHYHPCFARRSLSSNKTRSKPGWVLFDPDPLRTGLECTDGFKTRQNLLKALRRSPRVVLLQLD